jgi:hypothetical protein
MLTPARDLSTAPFPHLPGALRERFAARPLFLRPFGRAAGDLEINFRQALRPPLVTEILTRSTCDAEGRELDAAFFRSLPVSTRIECLLALVTAGGRAALVVPLPCKSCAQVVEVELTLDEISELQARHGGEERFKVCRGAEEIWARRPTGDDQLAWLTRRFVDGGEMLTTMVGTLVLDEARTPDGALQLDETWARALDEALDEFDPLVSFSLLVRCPECGAEVAHEVDLEGLALIQLRQAQQQLLMTVHRLASHYHWSEQAIFSVPHWRRLHYLSLIEREERW